jgi:hypothetical protein
MAALRKILVANTPFTAAVGEDTEIVVHAGDRFRSDHPVVKGREQFFDVPEADVAKPTTRKEVR